MTDAHRRKLLNWLTSMGMLILITNLCVAAYWFLNWPTGRIRPYNSSIPDGWDLIDWAGPLAEILAFFVPGFVICALWHGLDLIQRRPAEDEPARLFSRYPPFIFVLTTLGILVALRMTGEFHYTDCAMFAFDGCGTYVSPWLQWPTGMAMLLLVAFSIGKGIVAIQSRFKKAR
jgi:hypothetical protein